MAGNVMTSIGTRAERLELGVVLRPEGTFDVPAAWRLREAIAKYPPSSNVTLDFSGLRECHDFALAALLQAVSAEPGPALSVRGLCRHQERLLCYLGMRPSPRAEAVSDLSRAEAAQ